MGIWEILKGEQPGPLRKFLHYENKGQYGEYLAEFALTNRNLDGEMVVLKNLYVPNKTGGTSEIDLVMVHRKGIFVFECKNYSGKIRGNWDDLNWTQTFPNGEVFEFYNPIRQNKTHIKNLADYLCLPEWAFSSYIVFSERCTLSSVPADAGTVTIVQQPQLLKKLRKYLSENPDRYTHEEIRRIVDKLVPFTNKSNAEKQAHIEKIKNNCPYCGKRLVIRNGKYGKFWGCTGYPDCSFTKPVKNEK